MSSRTMVRSAVRPAVRSSINRQAPHVRFQSTQTGGAGTSHVFTGLASGAVVAAVSYGLYSFTPAGRVQSTINKTAMEATKAYNEATAKLQQSTPDPKEALDYLREQAYQYAAFIPGGRGYVDTAFKDLDTLKEGHGEEVDKIVRETYTEIQDISKGKFNLETITKILDALRKMSTKLGAVAADGLSDLMDNHPKLKDQLGPGADQLKQLGQNYGPEAKKQVDETWQQVQDIIKGGLSVESVNKVRQLVQEKTEQIKKFGDKAWKEGLEQVKPLMDKNPKVKELIEENADALKQGNVMELFQKIKDSVQSGKTDELQSYVTGAVDKAKKSSGGSLGGLEQYFNKIPGGSEILPKLSAIGNLTQEKSEDAQKLLKETMEKLHEVVSQQSKKAEELVKKS